MDDFFRNRPQMWQQNGDNGDNGGLVETPSMYQPRYSQPWAQTNYIRPRTYLDVDGADQHESGMNGFSGRKPPLLESEDINMDTLNQSHPVSHNDAGRFTSFGNSSENQPSYPASDWPQLPVQQYHGGQLWDHSNINQPQASPFVHGADQVRPVMNGALKDQSRSSNGKRVDTEGLNRSNPTSRNDSLGLTHFSASSEEQLTNPPSNYANNPAPHAGLDIQNADMIYGDYDVSRNIPFENTRPGDVCNVNGDLSNVASTKSLFENHATDNGDSIQAAASENSFMQENGPAERQNARQTEGDGADDIVARAWALQSHLIPDDGLANGYIPGVNGDDVGSSNKPFLPSDFDIGFGADNHHPQPAESSGSLFGPQVLEYTRLHNEHMLIMGEYFLRVRLWCHGYSDSAADDAAEDARIHISKSNAAGESAMAQEWRDAVNTAPLPPGNETIRALYREIGFQTLEERQRLVDIGDSCPSPKEDEDLKVKKKAINKVIEVMNARTSIYQDMLKWARHNLISAGEIEHNLAHPELWKPGLPEPLELYYGSSWREHYDE